MTVAKLIYGNGRGKTSNAMGEIFTDLIRGKKVWVIQFLKTGFNCGECNFFIKNFSLLWFAIGKKKFFVPGKNDDDYRTFIKNQLREIIRQTVNIKTDVLVLDELGMAIYFKLIEFNDILPLLNRVNEKVIITGRKTSNNLITYSDLLVEIIEEKHPFQKGIMARRGVDY